METARQTLKEASKCGIGILCDKTSEKKRARKHYDKKDQITMHPERRKVIALKGYKGEFNQKVEEIVVPWNAE